jgi:hypothetical protein
MAKFTTAEIQRAKQVSILQVAESCGIHVHKVGNSKYSWRSVENSGLVFSEMKNTFFLHSALFGQEQGTGGSTIDFVQMMKGSSFLQAVEELLATDLSQVEIKRDEDFRKAPFRDYFKEGQSQQAIKNYLIRERKIDSRIINGLIEKYYLREDAYHQVIFYWGKHGTKVGATVQGTTYNPEKYGARGRYKGIAKDSESGFGFNVQLGEKVERLYIFESPIDALSYWTLYRQLTNAMLVSCDGVKPQTVYNFINYLAMNHHFEDGEALERFQVFIGSDNDDAGRNFAQKLLATPIVRQQAPEYAHNRLFVMNSPSRLFKDWNEELQFVAQLKERDQCVNFEKRQVAKVEKKADQSYQVTFNGHDEDYQPQTTLFQVKNREETAKLLEKYDFERLSKHDLEKLGLSAFDRQATKAELQQDEALELAL